MNIKKVKTFLTKLPWIIAEHAFLACLILFILALALGGFLFYKYNLLAQKVELEILDQTLQLREETYQEVLKAWQEQEQKFQAADTKQYPNPFLKSSPE